MALKDDARQLANDARDLLSGLNAQSEYMVTLVDRMSRIADTIPSPAEHAAEVQTAAALARRSKVTITHELAVAVGNLAAERPDSSVTVQWDDSMPNEHWKVTFHRPGVEDERLVLNDETGALVSPMDDLRRIRRQTVFGRMHDDVAQAMSRRSVPDFDRLAADFEKLADDAERYTLMPTGETVGRRDRTGKKLRSGDRVQVLDSCRYGNPTGVVRGPGPDLGDGKQRVLITLDNGENDRYTPSVGRVERTERAGKASAAEPFAVPVGRNLIAVIEFARPEASARPSAE